jgi:GTP-binding protein
MRVNDARFIKSALKLADCPRDRKPECAFVGRSNVGKSTLLNALLRRKGLAKTSGTPGKTQTLNFFSINEACYFVDLPGYGFARVPKHLKEEWNRHMVAYLRERETLRLVVSLIDSRHKPTALDLEMLDLLEEAAVPTLVVGTKCDKLKRSQRNASVNAMRQTLNLDPEAEIILCSGETREGIRELWAVIDEQLALV